jgi:hypothetical protein
MKTDQHRNLIQRHLLGELAEADQTALERDLLTDGDKFEQVCAVENELIDSYLREEMSRADRERFEEHYLSSALHRERVEIARLFLADIDRIGEERTEVREREPVVPWWGRFLNSLGWPPLVLGGALVLAILFALGAVWSYLERVRLRGQLAQVQNEAQTERTSLKQREQELASRNQELEREIAGERQRREELTAELKQLRQQRPPLPAAAVSFLLTPAPVRSEKASPPPTIPLLTGKVRLLMELSGNDYVNYRVRLQTVEGQEVLRRHPDKIRLGKDRAFAALTLRAGKLTKGDYILILFGQTGDGKSEEIDRYFFRVS